MSRRFVAFLVILILLSGCRRTPTAPGPPGEAGPLAADSQGNLYIVQRGRNRVLRVSPDRKVTVIAGLVSPTSVALDPEGDLFIADTGNNRIRRLDAKTQAMTTVPGNAFAGNWDGWNAKFPDGQAAEFPPINVAADADENLYISGLNGMGIRRLSSSSHESAKLLASGYPGDPSNPVSEILGPYWLAYSSRGVLFYSEPNRNTVSLINFPLQDVHRIAGGGDCGFSGDHEPALGALLCSPHGVAVGPHRLVIADTGNSRIREVNLDTGVMETVAGNGQAGYAGDGGPAVNAMLRGPMEVAIGENGNLYIADTGNHCIRKVDARDGTIRTWLSTELSQ